MGPAMRVIPRRATREFVEVLGFPERLSSTSVLVISAWEYSASRGLVSVIVLGLSSPGGFATTNSRTEGDTHSDIRVNDQIN